MAFNLRVDGILSPCLCSGQRAEQTRSGSAAHPEPVRDGAERQQERQRHPAGALCGAVSGKLLAAPAERNQRTQKGRGWWRFHPVGAVHLASALTGHWHQNSQEEEAGAGQREDQEFVGVLEESKPEEVQLRTQKPRASSRLLHSSSVALHFITWTLEGASDAFIFLCCYS